MLSDSYSYQTPGNTYTLEQYISCKSDSTISYHNLSFIDKYDNIEYDTYNVLSDYIEDIQKDYCVTVVLSDDELYKYMYRPKLLCYDIYGNGELAFIIMLINDICDVKKFKKRTIYMPRKENMSELTRYLFNANKKVISAYNNKSK